MNLLERVQAVAESAQGFRWLGEITPQLLSDWVTRELGAEFETSSWAPYGGRYRRLIACTPILHVVAGETPHAALQSLMRGILVGAENWIKLPSNDLVEVRGFVELLPKELQPSLSLQLLPEWLEKAAVVVVFGSDRTIQEFAGRVQPWQRFVPHGHKISFAMVLGEWTKTEISGAIHDGSAFDQLGCLSPQFFVVKERAGQFAAQLAAQLESSGPIQLRTIRQPNSGKARPIRSIGPSCLTREKLFLIIRSIARLWSNRLRQRWKERSVGCRSISARLGFIRRFPNQLIWLSASAHNASARSAECKSLPLIGITTAFPV
jgi:Acyl-CoA reductase (LuxC)